MIDIDNIFLLNNEVNLNKLFNDLFDWKISRMPDFLLNKTEFVYQNKFEELDNNRKISLLSKLASHRITSRHYSVAINLINQGKKIVLSNDLSSEKYAIFLHLYGQYYKQNDLIDKAIESYLTALLHDPLNAEYNICTGACYAEEGKYAEADKYLSIAQEIIEEKENTIGFEELDKSYKWQKYRIFLNYGYIFGSKNEHELAANNFQFAIEYAKENDLVKQSESFGVNIYNLAFSFLSVNQVNSSLKYFKEALEFNIIKQNYRLATLCCIRINSIYFNNSEELTEPVPEKEVILKYAEDAIKFAEKNKSDDIILTALKANATVYEKYGMTRQMVETFKKITESQDNLIIDLTHRNIDNITQTLKEEINIQKLKTEHINQQKEQLIKSNSLLKKLNSVVVHDLKEPARTLGYRLDFLENQIISKISEKEKNEFDELRNSVSIINRILGDIANMTQITNLKIEHTEKVNLNDSIVAVKTILKSQIECTNTKIVNEELPKIVAKNGLIIQLFQNLINNAIKYNISDQPEIKISKEIKGDHFLICVSDNGIGISKHNLEKVFNQFTRFDDYQNSGTGLGLFISKKIVQLLGGEIYVESFIGEGSTFVVKFPKSIMISEK